MNLPETQLNFEWPEIAYLQIVLIGKIALAELPGLLAEDLFSDPQFDTVVQAAIGLLEVV